MKKSISLASIFLTINSFGLNMNEAIEYSLLNNNTVNENQIIILENKELLNSSKSLYKPKLDLKYTFDNKFQRNQDENKNDSELNIDLTYNLFNGFQDEKTIKSSKNTFNMYKYNYESIKHDLILKTKQDFIFFLQAQKNTLIKKSALVLFQKQYDDTKNFYDNGVSVTLNNLLEVEISLLESKRLEKEAISLEKISKERLFNTMGINIKENIEDIPLQEGDYSKYLELQAPLQTNELFSLKEYQDSLKNEKEALEGSYYPKVDSTLRHKRYGDSIALNERDGTYKPQNIAVIELSWNLYNGNKDKSNIIAYKHKINQINYQIKQLELDQKFNYLEAKEQFLLAIQNLKISKKAFTQAQVNYKIVNNSFKEGILTSKDLIDANYLLSSSEASYYKSYYTNLLAIATLERLLEITENKKDY